MRITPLLGEIKAEHYSGKTLRSPTTYQIDVLDEATIRGRYVLPILGITMVLELHRAIGRVTETIGRKEPTDYNCEPPVELVAKKPGVNCSPPPPHFNILVIP